MEKIRILGIHFSSLYSAGEIEDNWKGRQEKIEKTLCLWAKRNLSIKGKIIILKTLILSKINYIISSIGLPDKVLIQTNRILFRFLWKKNSRIRGRLKKFKEKFFAVIQKNGGLNMFDISQIQSAAFLQWAEAVCTGPEEDWKTIAFQTLRPVAGKAVFLSSSRTIKGINKVKNQF